MLMVHCLSIQPTRVNISLQVTFVSATEYTCVFKLYLNQIQTSRSFTRESIDSHKQSEE